jgi:hypothetical protein
MRKDTTNSFGEGMVKDLNPLTTPNNVLTDNLNGTLITYNGNEFVLQNDLGNTKVELAKLPEGFIPIGVKEYGGVIYIASLNTQTDECEIGCFPSPERDFTTKDFNVSPIVFNSTAFSTTDPDKTIVILKLFEQELFQLHPGDLYVTTYSLDPSKDISDDAKFNQYISKDVLNKKLFKLKYFKISDEGAISELPSADFNVVPEGTDLSTHYAYYKENSAGTLAVGLELEQLPYFEANIVDNSIPSDDNKKVAIEAVGFSDSMATFEGIRLDVELPEVQTYYLDKVSGNKVNAKISELIANSTFKASVTPYSKYMLYPKLKKNFQVDLGQYADPSSNQVNDIFRFKVEANYIKVDFDFKYAGDSAEGLQLYIEFYDPWSDYSILKTVDSPTFYGTNQAIVQLVDEPTNHIFNPLRDGNGNIIKSGQQGGTPNELLVNNTNEIEKTLLNSGGAIRVREQLRKNHFYIVRISGVEPKLDENLNPVLDSNGKPVYKYYDFYKALYTSTKFNALYDLQNLLNENDPQYYKDFTKIPYTLTDIKYTVAKEETNSYITPGTLNAVPNSLTTDGYLYYLSNAPVTNILPYIRQRAVSAEKKYNLTATLNGEEQVFGDFKTEIAQLIVPNSITPTITEPTQTDPDLATNTNATAAIRSIATNLYELGINVTTNRTEKASVTSATKTITRYQTYPVLDTIHYNKAATNPMNIPNQYATLKLGKYNLSAIKLDGGINNGSTDVTDDNDIDAFMNNAGLGNKSAFIAYIDSPDMWYEPVAYHSCRDKNAYWKQFSIMFKTSGGNYRLAQMHDWDTVSTVFTDLQIVSKVNGVNYLYTGNANTIISNMLLKSVISIPSLSFITRLTPSSQGTRTYLSKIEFRAKSTVPVDFSADIINAYILERKGNNIIIDNDVSIPSEFIPSISNTIETSETISFDNFVVSTDAITDLKERILEGQVKLDEITKEVNTPGEHGQLISKSSNNDYAKYISKFVVRGVNAGIPVNINNVHIETTDFTQINGYWAKLNQCGDEWDAPNLLTAYPITKTT